MAHEHIALITFRRMLSQLGYAFMGTGGAKANDITLLTSLYRNFMFSYLHGLVQKEGREPGRVAGDSEKKLAYARRTRVSTIYHLIPTVLNNHIACQITFRLLESGVVPSQRPDAVQVQKGELG